MTVCSGHKISSTRRQCIT